MKNQYVLKSIISLLLLLPFTLHASSYVNQKKETKKSINTGVNSNIRHKVVKHKQGAEIGYEDNLTDNVKLGGEMDFNDFSTVDFDSLLNFKQLGMDILATASLSLSDDFDLFAKAGMTNVEDSTSQSTTTDNKTVKTTPKVVIGSAYNVNERLSITGKVSHVFDENQTNQNPLLDKKGSESTGGSIGFKLKW